MANAKKKPSLFHGLPRVDAKAPVVLRLLPKDAKGARRKNPWNCVAARGACRQFHSEKVAVSKTSIHILSKDGTHYVRFSMPPSLKKEAHGFDRGGDFLGGAFQLSPFSKNKQLGQRQGSDKDTRNRTDGKPKMVRHYTANVRQAP